MAFLPFYIPKHNRLKIVIMGGGYAGIAALTTLIRYAPDIEITIIDPKAHHIKITHLHETFRYPLTDMLVSFADLENRFGCHHIRTTISFDENILRKWQTDKYIVLNDEVVTFDYLLIAIGSAAKGSAKVENVLGLEDFMISAGKDLFAKHLVQDSVAEQFIFVIGGGATGIQFLFEIKEFLHRKKIKSKLYLINSSDCVLDQFPAEFNAYAQSRMRDMGIGFFPNTIYRGQHDDKILLEDRQTSRQYELPSHLSLLFLGKKQQNLFFANAFGQAIVDQKPLQNIFVAGDCSCYNSFGTNTLTAQAAVRKGKLAARNILRHSGTIKLLEPYLHHELGYVVSLGPSDAVGWLASERNVVTGIPALAIKELVEAQYDLLLTGIDTYLI